MSKVIADAQKFNQVAWRLADVLGLVPEGATQIEADIDELMALAEALIRPRILTTLAEIEALPRGSVLLCKVREVFWLPPAVPDAVHVVDGEMVEGQERVWLAAGYGQNWTWSDEAVLEWGPLTVLHVGEAAS